MYVDGNVLYFEGKTVEFSDRIEEAIEYNNLIIIFLVGEVYPGNNIYAVNTNGDIEWNIKDIIKLNIDESYVVARKIGVNELKVISLSGIKYIINVYTQEILSKQIVK